MSTVDIDRVIELEREAWVDDRMAGLQEVEPGIGHGAEELAQFWRYRLKTMTREEWGKIYDRAQERARADRLRPSQLLN